MSLTLKIDNKEFRIGYSILVDGIHGVPDPSEYTELFRQLSKSPSSNIRREVASKGYFDEQGLAILLSDTQHVVLQALIENPDAAQKLQQSELLHIINMNNSELCCSIARNIENLTLCDVISICEKLASNDDPVVRCAIASYDYLPLVIRRELASDPDSDVTAIARLSLPTKQKLFKER